MARTARISYRHHPGTLAPLPLQAPQIWEQAWSLRHQLGYGVEDPVCVDLARIAERSAVLEVNGRPVGTHWDFTQHVHDPAGGAAFGVCLHDPSADPEAALLSINGPLLGPRDDLLRSTAIHELGHVICDVPSWIWM